MNVEQVVFDDELVLYIFGGLGLEFEYVFVNLTSKDSVTLLEAEFMPNL